MKPLAPEEIARLVALQRVLQHAVASPEEEAIAAEHAAGFEALRVPPNDAAALSETDPRRLMVYRKLVRATLRDAVRSEAPRTVARLGDRFEPLMAAWFAEELPRSQILRDVAFEVAVWATPHLRAIEPYLADLMRYELFEFDVYIARDVAVAITPDLAADQLVAFSGSTRLARFDFAVHRLPDDPSDTTLPEPGPVHVLGYRDQQGRFRQLDLTPMAGAILAEMLLAAQPMASAVQRACMAAGQAVTAGLVEGIAKVLADLGERGVVLGGRAETAPPPDPSPFFRWLYAGKPNAIGERGG